MDKEQSQVISFRVTEEVYEKLKVYAEAHHESVGDVLRKWAEDFASSGAGPSPEQPPAPSPGAPGELAELKKRVEELARREEELRGYVGAHGYRINEVQTVVTRMCAALWPGLPPPYWGAF